MKHELLTQQAPSADEKDISLMMGTLINLTQIPNATLHTQIASMADFISYLVDSKGLETHHDAEFQKMASQP